uniref:RNA helicase n=2 Tax=Pseudo-nitzschia australis TaxID=44445 RepID=A0A7S4ABF3_9STRA
MASSIFDPNETFSSLTESVGLDNRLRKAVQRLGHVRPTLVQSKCLPLAITSGRDLLVRAKTGSGKTLAYCLPLLQKILRSSESSNHAPGVRAVVLVPTRELCSQVFKTLQSLVYYCDEVVSLAVLSATRTGGRGEKAHQELARQKAMLRDRPDVIVATPAGLLTHIRNGDINLKDSMETLVVDEADLVLSYGYKDDVSEIIRSLPRICQGFLMSATLSPELNSLKKVVLHSPVVLKLENEDANKNDGSGHLTQFHLPLPRKDKSLVLYVFLKLGLLKGKGIFFVNSTDGGYRLKLFLEQFHIRSSVLNAELPFRSRLNIIEQFNVGNFDYLIATDESTDAADTDDEEDESDNENDDMNDDGSEDDSDAPTKGSKGKKKKDDEYGVSRGLDFRNVSFVVNVDFPPSAKSYAHRVGRTARGGAKGVALSLIENDSYEQHEILQAVQDDQPKISNAGAATDTLQSSAMESTDPSTDTSSNEQCQPSPLDFDLREIEGFRYRVEDVSRAVTKNSIKEARAVELRAEILNSERLQAHFEDNPNDLQLLRHDRLATHVSKVQEHLKHIPKYLLPRGMQVADLNRKRKKRKNRGGKQRRSAKDPLQSFSDGDVNLDGLGDDVELPDLGEGDERSEKKQKREEIEKKTLLSTKDGTGKSTSGRNAWKEKHKKGKFSKKTRLADRKNKDPLGI